MTTGSDPFSNCLRFGIVGGIFIVVMVSLPDRFWAPLNHATALMTGFLLSLAGAAPAVRETTITLNGFRAQVITECSGLYLVLLFLAFVLTYPAPAKARVTGILFGIPFLNAANIARLAGVVAIGAWRPALFDYAHVYLAQVMMVMLVCVTCLAWLRWASGARTGDTPFDFLARFVAVASVLFILWLPMHRAYVALLDRVVIFLFSLVDFVLFIPIRPEIYHHTLSLVVFTALVLASRNVGMRRRIKGLAAGLSLLVSVHILFRVTHVLLTAWHMESVLPVHYTIHAVNQYLLPVFLWLAVTRGGKTPPVCPLCGAEKVGLVHHIIAVHGARGLQDPRVRELLEENR